MNHGEKITVYGLPINPRHLVEELVDPSFCVSYATRGRLGKQLEQAISMVADTGLLLIDNGAFSNHQAGKSSFDADYLDGFIEWANEILLDCPQAIVVLPDVIDGTLEENERLLHETMCAFPVDRTMPVWHMHEPISAFLHLAEGFEWVAIGSSAQYFDIGTPIWHARMQELFAAIDAWEATSNGAFIRPRIHMMRAQSQLHAYPFDSADSCNVAMNHSRQSKKGEAFAAFAGRIDGKVQASAGPAVDHQLKRPMLSGYYAEIDQLLHQQQLLDYARELRAEQDAEEHAAILEYDAGLTRAEAEAIAFGRPTAMPLAA